MLGAHPNRNIRNRWFEPGEPYDVPVPVPSGISSLDDALLVIYRLLANTAAEIYAANTPTCPNVVDALASVSCGEDDSDRRYDELFRNSAFTREVFPFTLCYYEDLLSRLEHGDWARDGVDSALEYFSNLLSGLECYERQGEVLLETFRKVLDLPFWKYRWYVYEVWVTAVVIDILADYDVTMQLEQGDVLPLRRGSKSLIGTFQDRKHDAYSLVAQYQTPVSGYAGRQAVCPDVRINTRARSLPS